MPVQGAFAAGSVWLGTHQRFVVLTAPGFLPVEGDNTPAGQAVVIAGQRIPATPAHLAGVSVQVVGPRERGQPGLADARAGHGAAAREPLVQVQAISWVHPVPQPAGRQQQGPGGSLLRRKPGITGAHGLDCPGG